MFKKQGNASHLTKIERRGYASNLRYDNRDITTIPTIECELICEFT